MKNVKFFMCLVASVLFIGFASSCSDDDDDYPKTLKLQEGYQYQEFKVYVGTPEGGKELTGSQAQPLYNQMKSIIEEDREDGRTADRYLTFNSDNEAFFHFGNDITLEYKFEDGWLYVYSEKWQEWENTELYGDRNQLVARYSYYKCKTVHSGSGGIGQGTTLLEEMFPRSGYESLSQMTNAQDTIMWCNYIEVFK